MHAHFLVAGQAFLWAWVCLFCTPSVVWSSDPATTTQRKQQRTDSQPADPPPAETLPPAASTDTTPSDTTLAENRQQSSARGSAVFAGGCFWCIESDLEKLPGVIEVISGYSGGRTRNPTYRTYASGGHREVVFVVYDPSQITYVGLVEYLIKHIDPTNRMGQFKDTGRQYGPAIYYSSPAEKLAAQQVVAAIDQMNIFRRELNVVIEQRQAFWPAEEYHQNYHAKNLRKYQFYRAASGRDAFLQQHWGQRAGQLELAGAFPAQAADSGGKPINSAALAADLGGSSQPAQAPGNSGEGERALSAQDSFAVSQEAVSREALPQEALPGEPAWLSFRKPSPQALRQALTPMQYRVTQHDETEPAFQNRYWNHHRSGIYVDVVSGEPLFSSADKYESGTGWPSFVAPIDAQAVRYTPDNKLSYTRIEVRSNRGDSHLGHLFNDGPPQRGGKRYCLNSAALRFIPQEEMAEQGYADYLSLVGH